MNRLFPGRIFLLALVVLLNCRRAESLVKFDMLTYTVAEMMGPPQKLTIDAAGHARYESHSNNATPDVPEIGFYAADLSAQELNDLSPLLSEPGFAQLKDHWGRVPAGDRAKRISVSASGKTIEKMVGTVEPVDPAMADLLTKLDKVVRRVMQHPQRVLRLEMSGETLDGSHTLNLEFTLSNVGSESLECADPVALAGGPGVSVRGWPVKPPAQPRPGETFRIAAYQVTELGAPPGAKNRLTIAPGKQVSFRASARFTAPAPETYLTQFAYDNSSLAGDDARAITGELFSKIATLQVDGADANR